MRTASADRTRPAVHLRIGGEKLAGGEGGTFDHVDPTTGQVDSTIPLAGRADVDRAVGAAQRAFESWRDTRPAERRRLLVRLADLIEQNGDKFARRATMDNGTPISAGPGFISGATEWTRYYAGYADKISGDVASSFGPDGEFGYTLAQSYGVIGVIITWNGPLTSLTMKIPAAVAAGNTVVVKPSELTPFAAELFADLIDEAGFPAAGRVAPRRGGACLWGPLAGGYFIEPTVFADVDPYSELAQTEVFGPVVAIIPFSTEQEALSIANSTAYGLSSYIQTNDLRRAHRMTERLQAGGTMINGAQNLMVNTIRRARPEWFRERGWPSRSRRILANQDDRNRTLTRSGKGSR